MRKCFFAQNPKKPLKKILWMKNLFFFNFFLDFLDFEPKSIFLNVVEAVEKAEHLYMTDRMILKVIMIV